MVDVLKITSPISIKNKVHNLPSRLPTDAVFDITNPTQIVTETLPKTKNAGEETGKQSLLKNLNKEIFEPLLNSTKAQADGVRKLVLMARLFEAANGSLPESFLDRLFVKPGELLNELLTREKGAAIFTGEFFDSLRMLAKLEGQPKIKEAIVSILKYFDCYVNQENSLKAIEKQGQALMRRLPKAEAQELQGKLEALDVMIRQAAPTRDEIKSNLKNVIIPELGKIAKAHQGSEKILNQVMSIVHSIVRYDKADPKLLEEAVFQLGDELKPLTNLTDGDIIEMKKLVFETAIRERQISDQAEAEKSMEKFGMNSDDKDMASLISKALDKSGPSKVSSLAQNLLLNLVQSESPLIPLMHFTIPFRYRDENTYGEFFVDKDCKERKGDAKSANNIFFTIQSDKYGNFEVDLLERDKKIDLDIRCPDALLGPVREAKAKWKEIIEEQGFRLSGYQVGVYQESRTIAQRFPKLALRKVGIDVRV